MEVMSTPCRPTFPASANQAIWTRLQAPTNKQGFNGRNSAETGELVSARDLIDRASRQTIGTFTDTNNAVCSNIQVVRGAKEGWHWVVP